MEKYREKPFLEGFRHITWGKTKGFIVPLAIAALSILSCNILFELEFNRFNWPLSFLWFFVAQFSLLSLFYWIYKKTNRRSTFNIICFIIMCITMSFCLFDNETLGRVLRTPGMLAMGIFISQIPKVKIELDNEIKAEKITLLLNIVGFALSSIAFVYLAYLPNFAVWKLHVFICIVCPSLLYFATAIPLRSRFFNILGELSIFIYLAQCPILLHFYSGTRVATDYFGWLCFYAILLFTINKIVNKILNKRKLAHS
jgi:peptidoglycan/LPS O-acetylase OafA/YrhL